MNSFKRKALAAAVFAGLGSGAAFAGHIDPAGNGQYLIYPYYTVQQTGGNSYNTIVSVVNTTTAGKAVKVRFREGKNSREVLDFNLFLSPNDVWVGVVVPADGTTTSPAHLLAPDNSCTNPPIPAAGVDFRNFAMISAEDFVADKSLARTREGYLEMIEMAQVVNGPNDSLDAITHDSSGVPSDCSAVQGTAPTIDLSFPTGGLTGTGTIINVNNGSDMGYKPVAIANFAAAGLPVTLSSESANATDADPWSVTTWATADGSPLVADRFYLSDWFGAVNPGVDAISAMMMSQSITNEFVLDAATKSATDWVITFPTKRYYYASATPWAARTPFTAAGTTAGACETIGFTYFNREENGAAPIDADFSPPPPSGPSSTLCWEANVLSLRTDSSSGDSLVLGSRNVRDLAITNGAQNGWGRLTFTGTNAVNVGLASDASSETGNWSVPSQAAGVQRYYGLPVVGFMVRTFNNGTLTCAGASCQGNYAAAFGHNYERRITPQP